MIFSEKMHDCFWRLDMENIEDMTISEMLELIKLLLEQIEIKRMQESN